MGRVNYGPYIFDDKVRLMLQTFIIRRHVIKLSRSLYLIHLLSTVLQS
jgi:hypothetical protein